MRQFLSSLAVTLFLTLGAQAQENPIAKTITDQIAAFQVDDFDAAFAYASPNIKRLFGSPERFGQMVREGYPMVYRPAEVTMLESRAIGDRVEQRVMIRDASGRLHMLSYQMIDTQDGWQINGVQLLRAPEVGA